MTQEEQPMKPTPDIGLAGGALMTVLSLAAAVVGPNAEFAPPEELKITEADNVPCDAALEQNPIETVAKVIETGLATKGWTVARKDGIETFTATDGIAYVRARPDEDADVIVRFTRIPGMTDMRLVRSDESSTVKRAARKRRRENAELRRRGYDVPSE